MRLTPRVAGFRLENPAGFELECMAGFVGTRRERNPLDLRWLNGICEQFGYEDFSLAK
jgi:hypothetical protein